MGNNLEDSAIRGLMALTKNQKYPLQTIEWVLCYEKKNKRLQQVVMSHTSCSLVIVKQHIQSRLTVLLTFTLRSIHVPCVSLLIFQCLSRLREWEESRHKAMSCPSWFTFPTRIPGYLMCFRALIPSFSVQIVFICGCTQKRNVIFLLFLFFYYYFVWCVHYMQCSSSRLHVLFADLGNKKWENKGESDRCIDKICTGSIPLWTRCINWNKMLCLWPQNKLLNMVVSIDIYT